METLNLEPVAVVESCYPDKFGTPRQPGLVPEAMAKIKFLPKFQPEESLKGLNNFSHVWVIFYFHKNQSARFHAKVHPPRLGGETQGVFATRSPHRPNPIGLSLLEIVKVEADGVLVRGADIISGTPVLDIKPYLPEIESKPQAKSGWTENLSESPIEIAWGAEAFDRLQDWSAKSQRTGLRELIETTIQLDPRPTVYKGYEGQTSPYRSHHAIRFFEADVHFQFLSEQKVQIQKLIF